MIKPTIITSMFATRSMVCMLKLKRLGEQIPHSKHWEHNTMNQCLHQMILATTVYVPELIASPDASLISNFVLVLSVI